MSVFIIINLLCLFEVFLVKYFSARQRTWLQTFQIFGRYGYIFIQNMEDNFAYFFIVFESLADIKFFF
jgi:hypothetical protein